MRHYPFHVGDYRSATAHLTDSEDLAYRRLLDHYYDTEQPISLDLAQVGRRLRVDPLVIASVLSDFFVKDLDGWHHARCDQELEKYHDFANSGRRGAEKRWGKDYRHPIGPLPNPNSPPNAPLIATKNQEPRTVNQEPSSSISHEKIVFDGSKFQNINGHMKAWEAAYPALNIESELSKVAAWIVSNPKNVKKQWARFINGWLSRAQDKAPRVSASNSSISVPYI